MKLRPEARQTPADGPAQAELRAAGALFAAGRYSEAVSRCQTAARAALAQGNLELAMRATGNQGACHFAAHQYEPALESLLRARRLAERIPNPSSVAAIDANIASIYSEMGEFESAARWIESSLKQIRGPERRMFLPKLEIEMAVLRADQGQMAEAERLFRDGIEAADRAADVDTYALGCNRMGEAFLMAGDPGRAEPPLVEAFRVRKLRHLPLDTSYHRLGRLRLAQGDLQSASNLLDRAVELAAHAKNLMPTWDIYYSRGLVRLRQGRVQDALADLRLAMLLARDWQSSIPATEAARLSAEIKLDQASAAFIDAAGLLYSPTGDARLANEMFAAAEQNRAAIASVRAAAPPAQWWEALDRVERAEVAGLVDGSPARLQSIQAARAELARVEALSGFSAATRFPTSLHADAVERVQAALDPDSALFSFHLGETASWLWVLDREGMEMRRLPARAELERQAAEVRRAIDGDSADYLAAARRLYSTLFGQVPPRFLGRTRWLLSLDRGLFEVPIAALAEDRGAVSTYVAERHVVQIIPGALPWLQARMRGNIARTREAAEPLFLGIGDPIYNMADPRWHAAADSGTPARHASPFSLFANASAAASFTLPRLAASGVELGACARAWGAGSVLLEGAHATRARLSADLRRGPEIIHFATHFVTSAEASRRLTYDGAGAHPNAGPEEMIALSLSAKGDSELLTAAEIAHWSVGAALVALSGCHSANGAALPGAGRLGLTRAWLAAGARAVAGSLWDTPDDDGSLFASLYRHLGRRPGADPALALHFAQQDMIRAGGWQSQPRYWGAYFVVAYD